MKRKKLNKQTKVKIHEMREKRKKDTVTTLKQSLPMLHTFRSTDTVRLQINSVLHNNFEEEFPTSGTVQKGGEEQRHIPHFRRAWS